MFAPAGAADHLLQPDPASVLAHGARQVEGDMDKAVFPIDTRVLEKLTVADLISRYRDTGRGIVDGRLCVGDA